MQKPSSACGSSSPDRDEVARDLYLERGPAAAARRCEINQSCGNLDLAAELVRALELTPGQFVIDVCCGTGQHLERYRTSVAPRGRVMGFDFSESAIRAVRNRGISAEVADAAALPLPDASADALACAFGVYYLQDVRAALREWQRVLKPGGRLVVCGPARDTNRELYEFHEQAAGCGPSDADTMALGYIDDVVVPALEESGFTSVVAAQLVNVIEFEDEAAFLDYWRSTSLYARSPNATMATPETWPDAARIPLRLTKRMTLASARSPAHAL